jgi:hypothetical protein
MSNRPESFNKPVITVANAADTGTFPLSAQINLAGLQASGLIYKTAF